MAFELFTKGRKRGRFIDATRDRYGPNKDLLFGPRKVKKEGRIKFAGIWFQSNDLSSYVNQYVYIDGLRMVDSPPSEQFIYVYKDYWQKELICLIYNPDRFKTETGKCP